MSPLQALARNTVFSPAVERDEAPVRAKSPELSAPSEWSTRTESGYDRFPEESVLLPVPFETAKNANETIET